MAKQGLNQERVIQAAICLIEEKGFSHFSMGQLAKRLHIKTASLYNHVKNLESLLELVGEEASRQLVQLEDQAIADKPPEEALFALAEAYRAFALEHCELYKVILAFPKWDNPKIKQEASKIISPILQVLSGYNLTETQQFHWQRVLRALMSGFAFHEQSGGFAGYPVDHHESFHIAIQCVAEGLRRAGGDSA